MKIYCAIEVSEDQKIWLKEQLPEVDVFFHQASDESTFEVFKDCEVVFGNPKLQWVTNSDHLQWLQLVSAGLDPYLEVIEEGKVMVSNLKHFFSRPVAETAVGGILSLYRKLHELHIAQAKKKWVFDPVRNQCETIEDKLILILGPGSIGRTIREYLMPFGGSITMFGSRQQMSDPQTVKALFDRLSMFDIIVGALPETPETISLLNAERLDQLKETAIIVNVGRGSLIDEDHLMSQLSLGKLAGAFLDVTRVEPIPEDSPLWSVPNLLLSQHTGGGTTDEVMNKLRFCVKNFKNYLAGSPQYVVAP